MTKRSKLAFLVLGNNCVDTHEQQIIVDPDYFNYFGVTDGFGVGETSSVLLIGYGSGMSVTGRINRRGNGS